MYDLSNLQAIKQRQQVEQLEAKKHTENQGAISQLEETLIASIEYLVSYLDKKVHSPSNVELDEVKELLKGVLTQVSQIPKELPQTSEQQFVDYSDKFDSIKSEIIRLSTTLKNQPKPEQPKVNVPKTDFTPLIEALKPEEKEDEIELEDFKPHDIVETEKAQFIGYLSQDGTWYILKNNLENDKIRYHFGKGDYATAIKKAKSYSYKILSEAISEI